MKFSVLLSLSTLSVLFGSFDNTFAMMEEEDRKVQFRLALARNHLEEKKPQQAVKEFEIVIQRQSNPQFVDFSNLAIAYEEAGELNKAYAVYKKILPIDQDEINALRSAKLRALDKRNEIIDTDALLEQAYYAGGRVALKLNEDETAANFLLTAETIETTFNKPKKESTKYMIALATSNLGLKQKNPRLMSLGVRYYKKYFAMNPKAIDLDMYIHAANVAFEAQCNEDAEIWFRKVADTLNVTKRYEEIKLKNLFSSTARKLGGLSFKAKDYSAALSYYENFVEHPKEFNPTNYDYYNAGSMAYLKKDYDKVKKYLGTLSELPDNDTMRNDKEVILSIKHMLAESNIPPTN